MLPKNDLKNLKILLNKCNLNIERIILKSFAQGAKKIIKENVKESFAQINIGKSKTNLSIFINSSFVYSETFYFGTDIIMKDVSKVCSLNSKNVENIFSQLTFDHSKEEKYLDKIFFKDETFRKISLNHIKDIISARVEELTNLIFLSNINLKDLKKEVNLVYFSFEDSNIFKSLKKIFEKILLADNRNIKFEERNKDDHLIPCLMSAELIGKGWEREAIPTIQTKKSIISRIFSTFFN